MTELETDAVLSAIRRGEDSLPKLRSATGLDYARLHVILHQLEYEWKSIDSNETAQGFQRFTVKDSEALPETKPVAHIDPEQPKSNGHKAPVKPHPTHGAAYKALDLAEVEEVMATTGTVAAAAAKLGLTNMQLYTRRQKDEAVAAAVARGRERYYASAPAIDINAEDDEDGEVISTAPTHCKCGAELDYSKRVNMDKCPECWREYLKECREKRSAQKSGENITETITKPDVAKPEQIIPQIIPEAPAVARNSVSFETPKSAMAQVQVMGGMRLHEDIEVRISEMRDWPAERISEFFEALSKVIEIPQRTFEPKLKFPWPRWMEDDSEDGSPAMCLFWLMSLLNHNMEPHEKEAVWTLVQYLKRIEAYVEQKKTVQRAT